LRTFARANRLKGDMHGRDRPSLPTGGDMPTTESILGPAFSGCAAPMAVVDATGTIVHATAGLREATRLEPVGRSAKQVVGSAMERPGGAMTWTGEGHLDDAREVLVVAQYIEVDGVPVTMLHVLP